MASGYSEELALFQAPPVDIGVDSIQYVEYRPTSQISDASPIDFNIPGNTTAYIDLKRSTLKVKMRIVKNDGTLLSGSTDNIGLVNLPLQSLWSQVDIAFQQKGISSIGMTYPYKCMFDLILNSNEEVSESLLQSQLYFKDGTNMDQYDIMDGSNIGYVRRCAYIQNSKIVDLEGPLNLDICSQSRYILNGVQVSIKLTPSSNAFRLQCGEDGNAYKIEILDVIYKVCQVKVSPAIIIGHSAALQESSALYPYMKSEIKTFNIGAGQFGTSLDNIFLGTVPSRLVLGMVSSTAFSGNYKKNPFNFRHLNTSFVAFYVDGQSLPSKPIQPDFDNDQYLDAYGTLFSGTGRSLKHQGNYIQRNEYKNGYAIYVIDIDNNHHSEYLSQRKSSHSRLEIKFSKALPTSVTLIVYATFPSMIEIDASRSITLK